MAKIKNSNKKSKALILISKADRKHGKIKGKNKKETKQLRLMCPHYKITKKGHVKATIIPAPGVDENGHKYCVCEQCGATVRTKFLTDEDVAKVIGDAMDMFQQLKYMGTAVGSDKTVDLAAQVCVLLKAGKKGYLRTRDIAKKSGNMKKKKNKNNGRGSNFYGSWSVNK